MRGLYKPKNRFFAHDSDKKIVQFEIANVSTFCETRISYCNGHIPPEIKKLYAKYDVLELDLYRWGQGVDTTKQFEAHRMIPYQLQHLVDKISIDNNRKYYWWRALATAYFMRPQLLTKHLIEEYKVNTKSNCVGMYYRRGDKMWEMKLLNMTDYGAAASKVWELSSMTGKPEIVVSTESPSALSDAITWGRANNWDVLYNAILLRLFERKGIKLFRNGTFGRIYREEDIQFYHDYHRVEYIAQVIGYAEMMQCNAFVCTLASNSCRILDELRATIAAKPFAYYADISNETCHHSKCYSNDIGWFEW